MDAGRLDTMTFVYLVCVVCGYFAYRLIMHLAATSTSIDKMLEQELGDVDDQD